MRFSRCLFLLISLGLPAPCWALLGVGDVVYDPANVAQTINLLHQAQQEFDRLGTLLGVSTQQFDQLVRLTAALGNAGEAQPFAPALTPQQTEGMVRIVPGLEQASLNPLYNPNGQLDAFMGVPLAQWTLAVENPGLFYRTLLVNPAIARIAGAAGLNPSTAAYLQWYSARSAEDQYNLGTRAAIDMSHLLTGDWLQGAKQRRVNLQGLAAGNQDGLTKAAAAQTLVDQAHVAAQLQAGTNAILIESAAQTTEAREAAVRAAISQNQMLQEQNEERRNADELRLDAAL